MTTATKLHNTALLEDAYTPIGPDSIDEENGVIRNVKILGKVSENGVIYTDKAMSDAIPLYEGTTVNIDHPDRKAPSTERGFMEGVGYLQGVSKRDDGLYGDFHYYKTHPYATTLLERTRRNPKGFGLSHNADGEFVNTPDGRVIEKIRKVRSVDVVGKPATTKGIFESENEEAPTMKKYSLKSLVESFGSADEKRHLALLEDTSILDREVELEEDKASVISGFGVALTALHESGDVDSASKLLAAQTSLLVGPPPKKTEPDPDLKTMESLQEQVRELRSKNEKMEMEKQIATLCESESFKPDEFQVETLMLLESADKRIRLIQSWKDSGRPERSGRKENLENIGSYEEERAKVQAHV